MKKVILIIIFTIVFVAGIIYGGMLGDFEKIENVGSLICLSCMGIE
ncbi:hypothetical protein KAX97_04125 [candidate division WOR-3 bacterium]|nr:hypothetical protein [candidate division WOR-3 bacterium]